MIVKTEDNKTFSVDESTGEVLAEYETKNSVISKEESKHYKATGFNTHTARNTDEIEDYIKATVDKRKLIVLNSVRHFHDMNCGEVMRNGANNEFTVPAYKTMVKLVSALTISNCIICTKEEISFLLGCEFKDVKRALKSCKSLVRYQGSEGMQKGFVKLFINPAYGWKGESGTAYSSQQQAISDWYKDQTQYLGDVIMSAKPTKPFEITEEFDSWLKSFVSKVKPFKDNVYEDQAESIIKPESF